MRREGNVMKKMLAAVVAAGVALLAAVDAHATLRLSADINGTPFSCADQAACDTNPVLGQLRIADQTFNGVEIQGSSQFQTIGPTNFLNTSSFQIINHNLATATVILAINGIDFIGPASVFNESGSGTWQNADGSNIVLTYWGDPSNTQGANNPTDLPGTLLATLSDLAVGPADAFSFSQSTPFNVGPFFGMSLGTTGTLAAWNGAAGTEPTLVGRSQTVLATQVVPEPGSLVLLGIGVLAISAIRRKLHGQPTPSTPLELL
jgi:hypothetical protein